jgi:nicotinamidase/pyrazinamidase
MSHRKRQLYADVANDALIKARASPLPQSPIAPVSPSTLNSPKKPDTPTGLPPTRSSIAPCDKSALIIIDVQHDFLPGGSLAVPDGNKVLSVIKALRNSYKFPIVMLSQDWHPANHSSFASNNPGTTLFSTIKVNGADQVMWPDHCVQGSEGANIHPEIVAPGDVIIQKGTNAEHDSYSAFFDNSKKNQTSLADILKNVGVSRVYCVGLATDYCVAYTAEDAVDLGFQTFIIEDGCAGISKDGTEKALARLKEKGVQVIQSADILS